MLNAKSDESEDTSEWMNASEEDMSLLVEAEGEAGNREEGSHKELGWFDPEELPENLTLTTKKALEGYRRYLADRV